MIQNSENTAILEIKDLTVHFPVPGGLVHAVNQVNISFPMGKTVGIVGESGCGKSVLAASILRLHPKIAKVSGNIHFHGNGKSIDILSLPEKGKELQQIRGGDIGMIFQEPMRALFPLKTIGDQLGEAVSLHGIYDKKAVRQRSIQLLQEVGIRDPELRLSEYPHQFSGGMCQRVMIAIALASNPKLLIADEPTTSLDVTVQAQVLALIRARQQEHDTSILFITHDMGVIMEMADIVAVMYLGRIVEMAESEELFAHPLHPYTKLLFQSIPDMRGERTRRLTAIEGNVPIPLNLMEECGFSGRCPERCNDRCAQAPPKLLEYSPGHMVACYGLENDQERGKVE